MTEINTCWTTDPARIVRECLADPKFLQAYSLTVTPTGIRCVLPSAPFSVLVDMEPPVIGSDDWTGTAWFLRHHMKDRGLAVLSLNVIAESEPPSETFVLSPNQHGEHSNNTEDESGLSPEVLSVLHGLDVSLRRARLRFDTEGIRQRTEDITFNGATYAPRHEIAGIWYGYPFLFAYNGDTASLQVGGNPNASSQGFVHVVRTTPLWMAEMEFDNPPDVEGEFVEVITELFLRNKNSPEVPWLSSSEITALFLTLASRLKRSDFSFFFKRIDTPELKDIRKNWSKNRKIGPQSMGLVATAAVARARTLEEAREQLRTRYPYIEFEATPKEQDTRQFPDTDPPFTVLGNANE